MRILAILKWFGLALFVVIAGLVTTNCTMLGLNYASLDPEAKPAPRPPITAPSLKAWQAGRANLKAAFETHVYGPWPNALSARLIERRIAVADLPGPGGVLEELTVSLGGRTIRLGLALPEQVPPDAPVPLILAQTFADNCHTFANTALTGPDGSPCEDTQVPGIFRFIFGEWIAKIPLQQYHEAGFAYASYHASGFVPDSESEAPGILASLGDDDGSAPTGTLMAWAASYSALARLLATDPRLDGDRVAIFGHSRHAKSALVAGAWDREIDAVIAHQSGYGGAALSRSTAGEGVARITRGYPHWFDPAFATYGRRLDTLPVDQHQLLGLIAPTPVFLGNARRDVWSDPNATYRAAMAADRIYEFHDGPGLAQDGMRAFAPGAGIAYWLRPGGHGTDQRDIDAVLAFLRAHFVGSATASVGP